MRIYVYIGVQNQSHRSRIQIGTSLAAWPLLPPCWPCGFAHSPPRKFMLPSTKGSEYVPTDFNSERKIQFQSPHRIRRRAAARYRRLALMSWTRAELHKTDDASAVIIVRHVIRRPPTKIFLRCGKMPTPTSPSSRKPKRSTRSCNNC
jgi:hypothetical protein